MMGVPSLKLGVPSFYISFEFWKVVHPSVKAQCCPQVSNFEGHVWPPSDFLRATYYHSFKKGCCQLQAKVCAQITGYPLVQACPGKSVVR